MLIKTCRVGEYDLGVGGETGNKQLFFVAQG